MEKAPKIFKGKTMDTVFVVLLVIVGVLMVIAYRIDTSLPVMGVVSGMKTLLMILPILLVSFILSGMLRVMIPDELISNWIGSATSFRGILIGTAAGIITPGGPFVSLPIALTLLNTGAAIGPVVAYVTAWATIGLFRVPFEIAIVGPKFAVIKFVCSLILAPLAGYIASLVFRQVP